MRMHRAAEHVRGLRGGTRFSHSSAARASSCIGAKRSPRRMRKAADYAEQSDPMCNKQFRRRWREPDSEPRERSEREQPADAICTDLAREIRASWIAAR